MRFVQTLWCGGKSLSDYSFGWLNQESHLMSWALSCLSISKHYDVALYTDTEGKRMLVDRLKLPYKEVHVVYDDLAVLPHHWAIAKIKTYTLQVEPFIHVDGDIYIPNPLPDDILKAGLVAQNREIGTKYYRRMVDRMLSFGTIKLPRYIEQGLEEESISSYNMGIFGGNDVDFIHEYCDEALRFVRDNDINNASLPHSRVVCNIFFEQIILAAFADLKKREVASVLGRDVKDEGYSGFEFCDLAYYEQRAFFHLLGGHKRNPYNCDMLGKTLLRLYPEYYKRIIEMFPERNIRLGKPQDKQVSTPSIERCIARYEDFRGGLENEWRDMPVSNLVDLERQTAQFVHFNMASDEQRKELRLAVHPEMRAFNIPETWPPQAAEIIKRRLGCDPQLPLAALAFIPVLLGDGTKEVPLTELHCDIIDFIRGGSASYGDLVESGPARLELTTGETAKSTAQLMIKNEVLYLLKNGILILK